MDDKIDVNAKITHVSSQYIYYIDVDYPDGSVNGYMCHLFGNTFKHMDNGIWSPVTDAQEIFLRELFAKHVVAEIGKAERLGAARKKSDG